MTPQERELLTTFLHQMTQAQAGQKDSEADALIREACARQPEAAYLLVQRALGLDVALQAAQAQVAKLQADLSQLQPAARGGFLDGPHAWGASAPAAGSSQAAFTPAPSAPLNSTPAQAPVAAPARASAWGGSGMLGTVATTAAGVVAGSFLFQGIQGMMGHHNPAANASGNPLTQPPAQKLADNTVAANEFADNDDAWGSNQDDSETV